MLSEAVKLVSPLCPEDSGDFVFERFRLEPDAQVLPVVGPGGEVLGLVERNSFFLRIGANYGRALYARRPVSLIMDADPIRAHEDMTVDTFMAKAFGSGFDLTRGFVLELGGRYAGVGWVTDLLAATNAESRGRADRMAELAREQRRAAAAAEAAHGWLRAAIGAMSQGVALFDSEDRLVLWNHPYAGAHPLGAAALHAGQSFDALIASAVVAGYADAADMDREAWLQARLQCHAGDRESLDLRLADGRWIQISDRLLPNGGRVVMTIDVTELKAREESFRLMFDANPVPMMVIERETTKILRVNDAAVSDFQRPAEAYADISALSFLAPEDRAAAGLRLAEGRFSPPESYRALNGAGELREILPYVSPLTFEDRPALLMAVIDISERKAALEAMAQARDAAEAANRAKSEFLANMSHEIRTPLNGVLGVASALARSPLDQRQRELVRLIGSSAETLEVLLSDILDLARVESGRLELTARPFDAVELSADLAELFRPKAEDKGLRFTVEAPPTAQWALGDAVRIKQVLGNLLGNAVKFTERGEVTLRLHADECDGASLLRWSVVDTGIGFDAEFQTRMFGRFEQQDGSVTRRFGGSGLGLSISQQLAELMGGTLHAQSSPGRGSVFCFELTVPRVGSRPGADVIPAALQDPASLHILLAEDHPVNRRVVELMFEDIDVVITAVENGQLAVEAAAAQRFDVILMDMQMPVLDGLAATRALRGAGDRTPIVMLSANALPEHRRAGFDAGVDDYITKPVEAGALFAAIGRVLVPARSKGREAA